MVSVFMPLIYDIIKKISFLGINPTCLPWEPNTELTKLTSNESKIKIYINRKSLAAVFFQETELFLATI